MFVQEALGGTSIDEMGYYSSELNHNDNHMIWTDQQEKANVWSKCILDLCVSVHMGI